MNKNESKKQIKNLIGVAAATCHSVGYKGEFTSLSTSDSLTLSGEGGDIIVFWLAEDESEEFYRIHHTDFNGGVNIITVSVRRVGGELIVSGLKASSDYHVTVDCDENSGDEGDYRNTVRRVDVAGMMGSVEEMHMVS